MEDGQCWRTIPDNIFRPRPIHPNHFWVILISCDSTLKIKLENNNKNVGFFFPKNPVLPASRVLLYVVQVMSGEVVVDVLLVRAGEGPEVLDAEAAGAVSDGRSHLLPLWSNLPNLLLSELGRVRLQLSL